MGHPLAHLQIDGYGRIARHAPWRGRSRWELISVIGSYHLLQGALMWFRSRRSAGESKTRGGNTVTRRRSRKFGPRSVETLEDRALMSHVGHRIAPHSHPCAGGRQTRFVQTNLVSDGAVPAAVTDPKLVNPWGLAASSTARGGSATTARARPPCITAPAPSRAGGDDSTAGRKSRRNDCDPHRDRLQRQRVASSWSVPTPPPISSSPPRMAPSRAGTAGTTRS